MLFLAVCRSECDTNNVSCQLFCSVEVPAAMQYSHDALSPSVLVQDLAATNPVMSSTLECKRAATHVVKSLGLQADMRARAVVLAAADSTMGTSLRDLIQLNEDDPALKALVEELLRGEGTGKAMLCTDSLPFLSIPSQKVQLTWSSKPRVGLHCISCNVGL